MISDLKEFLSLSGRDRQSRVILAIATTLKDMGGVATRRELRRAMAEGANDIPEEYFTYSRPSSSNKSGEYLPFDFDFYMGVRELGLTGFVEEQPGGLLQLTARGRAIDSDEFDPRREVIFVANRIYAQRRKKKSAEGEGRNNRFVAENSEGEETASASSSPVGAGEDWRSQLATASKSMSPQKFEIFCRALVQKMGVSIDPHLGVDYSHDGGIDGFGYIQSNAFETSRVAIQAKRWEGPVGEPLIDQFRGVIDKFHAEYGIFITSSTFTRDAREAARRGSSVITLIHGEDIADLVSRFHLYVHPVTTYILDDFFTASD